MFMALPPLARAAAEEAPATNMAPSAAPADAVPTPSGAPPPPTTPENAAPRVFRHGPGQHLTPLQSLEQSVQRLTRGLDLNQDQQQKLRHILADQYRQLLRLRSGAAASAGSANEMMFSIYSQTRARIRAMLNEEQLKKYPAEIPRDRTAPAQADLKHWLQVQESARIKDGSSSQ